MKKVLCLLVAMVMLFSMAGALAESKEPVTLRFSWWGGESRTAATLEVIEQFQALYPYITIEAEFGSSDGYHDKLSAQLASGSAPDIIQIDPETMPKYVASGKDYFISYDAYNFDFSKFEEGFLRQRINGYYNGQQLGIPTGVAGCALVVNAEMAEKFNIDLSQQFTWDDMLAYGKAVHDADPEVYFMSANITNLTNMVFLTYAKQLIGKTPFDSETRTLNLTADDMQVIFEYIKALYDNNVIPPASSIAPYENDNLQSDPSWIAGKYVCAFAYVSTLEVLTAANTNATYYAGKLPALAALKDGGWAANCPQVMAISATSKNPEEAVMFMDYFFNSPIAMETLGAQRSLPPTEEARVICKEKGKVSDIVANAADITVTYGGTVNDALISTPEAKQILFDAIEQVAYGATTPEKAAQSTFAFLAAYAE